ncbi:MAG: DUF4038 domain-containing protein [Bryobacteraceae bacterium]|jgi:hypothetical protein
MKTPTFRKYRALSRAALFMVLTSLCSAGAIAQTGAATPQPPAASSPVYPLKVSANGRYLVDQNNKPFLITGGGPHSLMTMLSPADAERYFADRRAHGFNAVWINMFAAAPLFYEAREDGGTYDGIRPFTGYIAGGTDIAHYDLTKPNEAYFARVDQMLTLAAKNGLVVFLDPIDTLGDLWLRTLRNNGVAAAGVYGRYVGNRYKRFDNIIWLNGDDFNNWRTPENDAVAQAVAKGIKSADPRHLQTVELNIYTSSSLDDQSWAPIISLNSTYTYSATYIQMLHSYNQKPVIPTYLVEGHYDLERVGEPTDFGTPWVLRRQSYWTVLTGGTGQLYGNAYTWPFVPGWQSHIDTVGVTQLKIWKDFFSSLPWQDLVPDQDHTVVTAGFGTFGNLQTRVSKSDYCTAARTPDGSFVVAYMPTARTITVNMSRLKARANARWFDPANGASTRISGGPFANMGTRQFAPPGNNHDGDSDWVLLLDASGSTPLPK